MAYTKVSIPKNGDGAGCAVPKDPTIIIVDVEDIVKEPTRTIGNPKTEGELELKEGAKAVGVYATPATISIIEEYGGDPDARGVKQGVAFSHPGDSDEIKGFIEAHLNRGVVILTKSCDGSAAGKATISGNKCNPLFLTVESTINNEATKRTLTFKQELNSQFLPGTYEGVLPELAEAAQKTNEGA